MPKMNAETNSFNRVTRRNENNDEAVHVIDAGQSFIIPGDLSGGVKDLVDGATSAAIGIHSVTPGDLVAIIAAADTAECDVEVFVASK